MSDLIEIATKYFGNIAQGAVVTLQLTAGALILSTALGLVIAGLRLSGRWWLRAPAVVYIEVIRNTPALLQLFLIYFGLAELGLRLDAFPAAILTLGILGGAFLAEIFRGGILSVDRGQAEAALSLGMRYDQMMRRIVLPQAFRVVIPPSTNYLISLLKETSLVLTIAVPEIMYRANNVASATYQSLAVFAIAGAIYFALCFPLSRLAIALERKLRIA